MKSFLIIDAFALAFRSFYAYPLTLTIRDGQPINAVFGMITLIFQAIDQIKPSHLVVCFDSSSPTFRHESYPLYKANRTEAPDEFKSQVPLFKKAISDCGFFSIEKPGFEADDLIGRWSKIATDNKLKTFVYTGDQDTFQLVNNYVSILMPQRGTSELKCYDRDAVFKKTGVYPENIIDFKALKGDSSDNIPGVKGVGDKTAAKLITEFSSLESIYNNLSKITSSSLQKKLEVDKDNAFISKNLARIETDFKIDSSLEDTILSLDWKTVYTVFNEFNFTRLITKYESYFSDTALEKPQNNHNLEIVLVDSISEINSLILNLKNGFSFDIESTSLTIQNAQIVGISFCFNDKQAYYIPFNKYVSDQQTLDQKVQLFNIDNKKLKIETELNPYLSLLKPIFEDSSILKIAHNAKFDIQLLKRYNIEVQGEIFDTMIASFLLYPLENVGLKNVVNRFFNYEMATYESIVAKGETFFDVDIEKATKYAAEDAFYTYQLKILFENQLQEKGLKYIFDSIECPVLKVLADMEYSGVEIDLNKLHELNKMLSKDQLLMKEKIYSLAGKEFNINSTQQLAEVLFDDLKLPVIKKTKTGRSTNIAVLEELSNSHDIINYLIEYRSNEKLLNTYVNALPHLVHNITQKVHTTFNQTVVITGRLSSTSPNLQNIPIRNEKGALIRSVVKSRFENGLIIAADYSQIELRLMAHFSNDKAMIDAFNNNIDIHKLTASKMFNCSIDDVSKDQRYQAKAVNFGIIYGISAFGLSKNIAVSRKEAQVMIDDYFNQFPKIKLFMDETIKKASKNGYIVTEAGRIRPLNEINSSNFSRRNFEQRAAVNTLLQGTAAELIKRAMISIYKKMVFKKMKSKMIIQVHDELVFDVFLSEKESLIDLIRTEMQSVSNYAVDLLVDVEIGKTW